MVLSLFGRPCAAALLVVLALSSRAHFSPAAEAQSAVSAKTAERADAPRLVRQALTAEAAGDAQRRAGYLQDALTADPSYAPAHWHSGEVRSGQCWLSASDAATEAMRAGKVAQYRKLRDEVQATADSHMKLARWCAESGLPDQERFHLLYAGQYQPTKKQRKDIADKLGVVRRNNVWVTAAEASAQKQEAKKHEAALREWKPRLVTLRRDIESNDAARRDAALQQLGAIDDAAAIPALESVFTKVKPAVALAVVNTISGIKGQAAVDSLLRYATFAPQEEVRKAAATALAARPIFSYVPTLIAAMQSPIEVQFEANYYNGQTVHRLVMYQPGATEDQRFTSVGGSGQQIAITVHPRTGAPPTVSDEYRIDETVADDAQRAKQALAKNVMIERTNERLAQVLQVATGNDFGAEPQEWWKWWNEFNEMYLPPVKPVNDVRLDTRPAMFAMRQMSCFVAGTPVWTSTGPLPIEKVQAGDSVLAQDPDTGELAFKPVLVTTLRPPSPLVEIYAGRETIRVTRGHPFWVDGLGWQMAKELKAGQNLHTTAGPLPIDNAEQNGEEAECYNLVVADFNTYFVGNQQILVHDNMLREVTTATVPGLVDP